MTACCASCSRNAGCSAVAADLTLIADADLSGLNTLGLPGTARCLARVGSEAALARLLTDPARPSLPVIVLGGGSNIVLAGPVEALLVKLDLFGRVVVSEAAQEVIVEAGAGESWHALTAWAVAQGWGGLENLSLIPGTVGAAPVQNIGAYGVELCDVMDSLTAFDRETGRFVTLDAAECRFAYRDSLFKSGQPGRYVITRVRFRLQRHPRLRLDYGDLRGELARAGITDPGVQDVAQAVIAIRRSKLPDPAEIGNAGSFFKNPSVPRAQADALRARFPTLVAHDQADGTTKLAAGWLIDQAGWKGCRRGAVGVHDRQALVLTHTGGGSGRDLLALAAEIRASVQARYGVSLEQEPVILGG